MSIFEAIPTCEVCHERACERIDETRHKKRCSYCADRFDSNGQPFIVYCEIISYKEKGRPFWNSKVDREYFWLMDGIVVKPPYGFSAMMRKDRYDLDEIMNEMNYELVIEKD